MNPEQSNKPAPERHPNQSGLKAEVFKPLDPTPIRDVSSIHCFEMGFEDFKFLAITLSRLEGGKGHEEVEASLYGDLDKALEASFDEVAVWLTPRFRDPAIHPEPDDEALFGLSRVARNLSWEIGRRAFEHDMVEYFAILRLQSPDSVEVTLAASKIKGAMDDGKIAFSAAVSGRGSADSTVRHEHVERLLRLCGLSDFVRGTNGADFVARSATLEAREFSIFCAPRIGG